MRNYYKSFISLITLGFIPLYQRRKKFFPLNSGSLFYPYYLRKCRIDVVSGKWMFDFALNLGYELNTEIGDALYYQGQFEQSEIDFLKYHVLGSTKDAVILDIGANIGLHSIALAKYVDAGLIFSFEPSPGTSKILSHNVKVNGLDSRVVVKSQAVSKSTGEGHFFLAEDNAYSSLKDTMRKAISETITVEMVSIDDFCSAHNLRKVDLIKIDVEGLEHEVVEGGIESFKKYKPDLFVEIYQGANSNRNPELTIKSLIDIGYRAFVFVNGELRPFVGHSDTLYNYYFTMKRNLVLD